MNLYLIDNGKKAGKQRYRWRAVADNGEIIGASSEGFATKRACELNVFLLTACIQCHARWKNEKYTLHFCESPKAKETK